MKRVSMLINRRVISVLLTVMFIIALLPAFEINANAAPLTWSGVTPPVAANGEGGTKSTPGTALPPPVGSGEQK